jgi:ankyrin repeat protein
LILLNTMHFAEMWPKFLKIQFLLLYTAGQWAAGQSITPDSVLFRALRAGDYTAVAKAINSGASANARDAAGNPALMWTDSLSIVKLLLDKGAFAAAPNKLGETPLHRCANAAIAELLLSQNAAIAALDKNERTPLHTQAFLGHADVVVFLIKKGCSPSAVDKFGQTPLHLAAIARSPETIRVLLEARSAPNATDKNGNTPLLSLILLGNNTGKADTTAILESVRLLLNKGADPNRTDPQGGSLLYWAMREGRYEIVDLLIRRPGVNVATVDKKGNTPLDIAILQQQRLYAQQLKQRGVPFQVKNIQNAFTAALSGNVELLQPFLSKIPNANVRDKNGDPLLLWAGSPAVAKWLIEKGASPDALTAGGTTVLIQLIRERRFQIADAVVNAGADLSPKADLSPLHEAIDAGAVALVENMLDRGAEVNLPIARHAPNWTPLCSAAAAGDSVLCRLLIGRGARVNINAGKYTPLLLAVEKGRKPAVEVLLNAGAEIVPKETIIWNTALHQAAERGDTVILDRLLEANPPAGVTNWRGITPLHLAANSAVALRLIERGAPVNAKANSGETPLHAATRRNNYPVVELLLSKGADATLKDSVSKTAFDISSDTAIKNLLKQYENQNRKLQIDSYKNENTAVPPPKIDTLAWNPLEEAMVITRKNTNTITIKDNPDKPIPVPGKYDTTYLPPATAVYKKNKKLDIDDIRKDTIGIKRNELTPKKDSAIAVIAVKDAVIEENKAAIYYDDAEIKKQKVSLDKQVSSNKEPVIADTDTTEIIDTTMNTNTPLRIPRKPNQPNLRPRKPPVFNNTNTNINTNTDTKKLPDSASAKKPPFPVKPPTDTLKKNLNLPKKESANAVKPKPTITEQPDTAATNPDPELALLRNALNNGLSATAADAEGLTPLHRATSAAAAALLIGRGAKLNATDLAGRTPLHDAAFGTSAALVQFLISKGAAVNAADSNKQTPLHLVQDASIAKVLIEKGAVLTARDKKGRTPLHLAAGVRPRFDSTGFSHPLMQMLKFSPATVRAVDKDSLTPLHLACCKEVAELLIKAGASVNATDRFGKTPLHYVTDDSVAALLMRKGADLKKTDKYGRTPLHEAVRLGRLNVAALFISKGAAINSLDKAGQTPLDLTYDEKEMPGTAAVRKLLLEKGAKRSSP